MKAVPNPVCAGHMSVQPSVAVAINAEPDRNMYGHGSVIGNTDERGKTIRLNKAVNDIRITLAVLSRNIHGSVSVAPLQFFFQKPSLRWSTSSRHEHNCLLHRK